jgi:hypothetical protein
MLKDKAEETFRLKELKEKEGCEANKLSKQQLSCGSTADKQIYHFYYGVHYYKYKLRSFQRY